MRSKETKEKDKGSGIDSLTGKVIEDETIRNNSLKEIRHLMSLSDVKYPRDDDKFLLAFLRAKKHRVEDALKILNNFAKFWYSESKADLINGLCAARVRPIYEMGFMQFLPNTKDKFGNIVTALRMGSVDATNPAYTPRNMMALSVYILCNLFEDEEMQFHGACYVETFEGFSLLASMQMAKHMGSNEEQKEMMSLASDTFPMRIRDIYVINQPWYFSMFWNIVKPFINEKIKKRLHMLGKDISVLHEHVPMEGLPPDFGGTNLEPISKFLDDMERKEKEDGMIGGFCFPLSVDDPTGEKRRASKSINKGDIDLFLIQEK